MRVLLAGGGTAGHINPALAIAASLKENVPGVEILFAGTPFGMEAALVPRKGYAFTPIRVKGFQRKLTAKNVLRNLQAGCYLCSSAIRARQILKEFRPDLVIGTGGYVSGPIVRAASKMGIKTAIHEQNAFPGITTKLLAKHVGLVMLAVKDSKRHLPQDIPVLVTGNPVRPEILTASRTEARRSLGIPAEALCILSYGGSLGAGKINETVLELLAWEQGYPDIYHIHGYGGMGKESFPAGLRERGLAHDARVDAREYLGDMDACMAAADLVICRAGAITLSELQAMGRASILIPSPIVAENHQYHNAMVLQKAGAAIVIEQKDLTAEKLVETVDMLCRDRSRLDSMAQIAGSMGIRDAGDRILEALLNL